MEKLSNSEGWARGQLACIKKGINTSFQQQEGIEYRFSLSVLNFPTSGKGRKFEVK